MSAYSLFSIFLFFFVLFTYFSILYSYMLAVMSSTTIFLSRFLFYSQTITFTLCSKHRESTSRNYFNVLLTTNKKMTSFLYVIMMKTKQIFVKDSFGLKTKNIYIYTYICRVGKIFLQSWIIFLTVEFFFTTISNQFEISGNRLLLFQKKFFSIVSFSNCVKDIIFI